jgi:hypothetical protein
MVERCAVVNVEGQLLQPLIWEVKEPTIVPDYPHVAGRAMCHMASSTGRGENGMGKSRTVPVPYTAFFVWWGHPKMGRDTGRKQLEPYQKWDENGLAIFCPNSWNPAFIRDYPELQNTGWKRDFQNFDILQLDPWVSYKLTWSLPPFENLAVRPL